MKYKIGSVLQIRTDVKNKSLGGVIGIVVDVNDKNNVMAVMMASPGMSRWEVITAEDEHVEYIGEAAFTPGLIQQGVSNVQQN